MKSCLFSILLVGLFTLTAPAQGPLSPPPGPPGPTMKTLDQIEPRTDIATLPGDGTYLHVVSVSGSYFLSGNLTNAASGKGGIVIAANDVTIDLAGFSVTNSGASPVEGIRGAGKRLTLHNGSVRGWSKGVTCNLGGGSFDHLMLTANSVGMEADRSSISDCVAEDNSQRGFSAGSSTLTWCAARNNYLGFFLGDNAILTDCVATANSNSGFSVLATNCILHRCSATGNSDGFTFAGGNSFIDCVAASNDFRGFSGGGFNRGKFTRCSALSNKTAGFTTNNSCSFESCNASNNGGGGFVVKDTCRLVDCVAEANGTGPTGTGITAGIRVTVLHCTVTANQADGISAGGDAVITENHVSLNGAGGTAAGIHTTGGGSRIEGNQVRETTGTGILATTNDSIIRNSSGGNTTNYNPSSGANFAPVQSPSTATNPLANLSF
jgi:hypothetical protein